MGRRPKAFVEVLMVAAITICMASSLSAKNTFTWRCVIRPGERFTDEKKLQEFEAFMVEMKKHDYNGVIFGGVPFTRLHTYDAAKKNRLHQMLSKAEQLGIAIIPLTDGQKCPKNLENSYREGFYNKATPFVVSGTTARVLVPAVTVKDPGFEQPFGNPWKGGGFVQDLSEKKGGNSSLRIDNPVKGSAFRQTITVTPYRTYELTVFVKLSRGVDFYKNVGFAVIGGGQTLLKKRDANRNSINSGNVGGSWFLHTDEFNSRQHATVELRILATERQGSKGSMWFDDVKVQEVGLYNTVRRSTLPFSVKSADGNITYKEGTDYVFGEEKLDIPAGSAIKNGDKLAVDWFTLATPNTNMPPIAFCNDDTWTQVREYVSLVDSWFKTPPARFMAYSEWRVAGWDPACISQFNIDKVGSGPYYGHVANTTESIYRAANGNREVLVYNDDFDPYHNAKPAHGSVNGGSAGSWDGLTEKTIVVNWNVHNRKESMMHFAGLNKTNRPGFGVKTSHQRQIMSCGRWGPGVWGDWLKALEHCEANGMKDGSVLGVAFHTYVPDYSNIGPMADFYKNAGRWASGPIRFPEAGVKPQEAVQSAFSGKLAVSRTAQGIMVLSFDVTGSEHVNLSVYNLRGQMAVKLLDGVMAKGAYQRTLDTSRLAAGMYFIDLTVGKGHAASKIAKKVMVF